MSGVLWLIEQDARQSEPTGDVSDSRSEETSPSFQVWLVDGKSVRPVEGALNVKLEGEGAKRLANLIAGLKLSSCTWVLSPLGSGCFFVPFEPTDSKKMDAVALGYELESHLPIDAEFTAADFQSIGSQQVAAVAADARIMQPWLQSLQQSGIQISAIVPRTLMIVRGWLLKHDGENHRLWISGFDHSEVVDIENSRVISWKWLPGVDDTIAQHVELNPTNAQNSLVIDDIGGDVDPPRILATYDRTRSSDVVADSVRLHARGKHDGWWNLMCGPLAPSDPLWTIRRPLRTFAIAVGTFIAAIWMATWFRGDRIEREIQNLQTEQQNAFRETYPDRRVPAATLRLVRSEYARALGSRGAGTQIDAPLASADILRRLLVALPRDLRVRITRIEIQDENLGIDAQVQRPVDAGSIATALAAIGFDVKPPITTQRDTQTYDSTIEAVFKGENKIAETEP
jgi:hypothetical protein